MYVLNGLRSDVFRTVLVIIIPGLVAGVPLLFILEHFAPGTLKYMSANPTLASFLVLFGASTLGMIATQFGTRIEVWWIDRDLAEEVVDFESDWMRYLRCTLPDDLVAKGYINGRVLHLQFELAMSAAFVMFCAASTWAWSLHRSCTCGSLQTYLLIGLAAAIYFAYEAKSTAKLLARLRKELLTGIGSKDDPIAPASGARALKPHVSFKSTLLSKKSYQR